MKIISDEQIREYISEIKTLPKNFKPMLKDKNIGHFQFNYDIVGENGNSFKIIIRQNKINPLDFSVIFGVLISGKLFKLVRYNGEHGEHTNKLDGKVIEGFHIHRATKIYQENGFREEGYAEKSNRYSDWKTALKLLLEQNNFQIEVDEGQRRLK